MTKITRKMSKGEEIDKKITRKLAKVNKMTKNNKKKQQE